MDIQTADAASLIGTRVKHAGKLAPTFTGTIVGAGVDHDELRVERDGATGAFPVLSCLRRNLTAIGG